jgi:phosphatidylethanolamine/phosphatidyl-N-methylethanolamine N-methyltransferase
MSFPDATFDKVVAMYVISAVPHPERLLEELHRVCKPDGEILLVNHVSSDNRLVKVIEKGLARFSDKIGFRPDFEMRGLVTDHDVVQLARVNVFWKVMRLRNGVSRRIK